MIDSYSVYLVFGSTASGKYQITILYTHIVMADIGP